MNARFTEHAQARKRERGIAPATIDDVPAVGRTVHDHRGGTTFQFDRRARAPQLPHRKELMP